MKNASSLKAALTLAAGLVTPGRAAVVPVGCTALVEDTVDEGLEGGGDETDDIAACIGESKAKRKSRKEFKLTATRPAL